MINQQSNNKASGYTSKQCDAGIPISGRTNDTGIYEIVKVTTEGEIIGAYEAADKAINNHPYLIDVTSPVLIGNFLKIVPILPTILDTGASTWASQDNLVMDASLFAGVTLSGIQLPIYMKMTSVKIVSGLLLVYMN